MTDIKGYELIPMEETVVVRISPENSTLLIDTAAELNKGFIWLNDLLGEVLNQRYIEDFEDDNGKIRSKTKFHPMTMKLIEERRKTIDQMYKILGGEASNEAIKEFGKLHAKAIFEASRNPEIKKAHIDVIKGIIEEAEFVDDNDNSETE